jgi:hypothetical protein
VSRRRLAYIGIAIAVLVGGRLFSTRSRPPRPEPSATAASPTPEEASAPTDAPLRHPPSAVAELGILTDRQPGDIESALDRDAVAALLRPALCGDATACEAAVATLRDPHATTLHMVDASDWNVDHVDLDASAAGLRPSERASVRRRSRLVVVRVSVPTSARHLAVRTAFAAAAALAERIDGLVFDQLLGRIENARDFAAHAMTGPVEASSFRRDRIQLLYEPKGPGIVRILTAGLSRWGVPDVEATAVPEAASERVAEIVLGVAEAVANGARAGPLLISRDDLGRVRGRPYADDAGLPASTPVAIEVVSANPEAGDPNDFMARIVPPASEGPLGFVDLAERFFGPVLAASPEAHVLRTRRQRAQRELASALVRWGAARANGARLLVQVAFAIPGDAGVESMWVEVTRYDGGTVSGTILDDPLAATDVARGDVVTRRRDEVEDVQMREP